MNKHLFKPVAKALVLLLCAVLLNACATRGTEFDYSGQHAQAAILKIPENITLLALDDEAVKLPLLMAGEYQVRISPGDKRLEFIYEEIWGQGETSQLKKTPVQLLEFEAQPGQQYQLTFTRHKGLMTPDRWQPYLETFKASISDGVGQTYSASNTGVTANVFTRYPVTLGEVKPALDAPATMDLQPPADTRQAATDTLNRLKALWYLASETERRDFMDWVVEK